MKPKLKVAHDEDYSICYEPIPSAPSKHGGVRVSHDSDSPRSTEDDMPLADRVEVFLYGREFLDKKKRKAKRDSYKHLLPEKPLVKKSWTVGQWNPDTKEWEK